MFKLIVGLGNPGRQYERTRHNAGFWWVDALAEKLGGTFVPDAKYHGHTARVRFGTEQVWLLKPMTFMNLSGKSVAALANFYQIEPEQMLVVYDELDLPVGTAKVKKGGGTGGHNGLTDIVEHLGTKDFWRMRLGIGHPGHKDLVVGYVLKAAPPDEQRLLDKTIADSMGVLPFWEQDRVLDGVTWLHTNVKAPPAENAADAKE